MWALEKLKQFRKNKTFSASETSEDPPVKQSGANDAAASYAPPDPKSSDPQRDPIVTAAREALQTRSGRLGWFEWGFFGYSLCICSFILYSIHSLSHLYFYGHLLEDLGKLKDWHVLVASDAIFAGLTLIFMTVFLSALKIITSSSDKLKNAADETVVTDTDNKVKSNSDGLPSYLHNIISALKDLATAIKGFPK